VSEKGLSDEQLQVNNDDNDFYGRKYWQDHQVGDLGLPDIHIRARNDLSERNLHWLKTLLKYRLPPAKVLELGCSHGGFLALLRQAGYDVSGVEMSPWVVEFGQKTFGVPISVGPIESLENSPGGLDVVVLMDVLEHLPDPVSTMATCLKLLKPDGIMLVQAPQFREEMDYEELVETKGAFLEMLMADEHLYLFSERSVTELFHRLGADYIEFETAIFSHYDMFFVVSRHPLKSFLNDEVDQSLLSSTSGRIVLAMLDLRERELILASKLHESELDRAARLESIEILTDMVHASQKSDMDRELSAKLPGSDENDAAQILQEETKAVEIEDESITESTIKKLKTVAVDLTPVLPGGHNGGAKVFVLELIRRLSAIAPDIRFVLLTHEASHEELALLDAANVSRQMVVSIVPGVTPAGKIRHLSGRLFGRIPARYRFRLKRYFGRIIHVRHREKILSSIQADLLFCPFTAPTYHSQGVPTVCTLYDIQYKTYPQFFEPMDVMHRDQAFKDACRYSTAIAAISNYARTSALEQSSLSPDHIRTVYLKMAQRINAPSENKADLLLSKLGLASSEFLLYPANFWKHKNHEMLLLGFLAARTKGLPDNIMLVCTGAPGERLEWLQKAVTQMGLASHVVLPGYLSDEDLSLLLHNCRGMIFPSLYEGFGLPVIEAMAAGIPVACSNVTSLPEISAGAALLFDPRIPEEIASAMRSLVSDGDLRKLCIEKGYIRAGEFTDSESMARDYLDLFKYALGNICQIDLLSGVYADGWASEELDLSINPKTGCRFVEFELFVPEWLPHKRVQVECLTPGEPSSVYSIDRGRTEIIRCSTLSGAGLRLRISPGFIPADYSDCEDARKLSVMVKRCTMLLSNDDQKQLYPGGE
jgi:glycosyltransferase involved in cell wall biosynthesis/2-polyprenyl-3-methyl-5-hydroxy-6-metoxy-1,4-benzoquinol methylase